MAASSQYLSILENIVTQVNDLGLMFGTKSVQVLLKKISRWTPGVALPSLPIILVVGADRPDSVVPWDTENNVLAKYNTAVITAAAGNEDNIANLDVWLNWREQQRRLLQWGMSAQISNAFFSEFISNPPILKDAFLKGYDLQGFGFLIWNVEPRTN